MLRDILTSTQNTDAYNLVFDHINSERAKDLSLWLEFGLSIENIGEILETLQSIKEETH